jgi:lipopolysaccharide export system permease protein
LFGSILSRMIFWELVKVFTLSLIGINGIMLMGGIVAEASRNGLSLMQILTAIPLLIPSLLPYTVPATTLFATCVVYGRLSHDNEILAIRAAGINLSFVLKPALVLGLSTGMATFALYHSLIPYTHLLLRSMVLKDVEALIYSFLKRDGEFKQPRVNYSIFVRKVEGRELINAIFKRRDAKGEPDAVIMARKAVLQVDPVHNVIRVILYDGIVWNSSGTFVFRERQEEEDLPASLVGAYEARPSDLTWEQIRAKQIETREAISETDKEISEADAVLQSKGRPSGKLVQHSAENLPQHKKNLSYKSSFYNSTLYQLNAELQIRPALSLGCFFFVLIGCPVGIWFSRSDYLSAFMTCFLPIVFIYYPLLLCGTNLAKEGRFIPELCVWGADAFIGVIGLFCCWKLLRS